MSEEMQNCACCPGNRLGLEEWARIAKKPFRKRHPILYWIFAILGVLVVIILCARLLKDEDGLERIALVSISGPIMDVGTTLEWIRTIGHNPLVKGVLVRVDSPGGGAAASQEIYAALLRLRKRVPIAVSMGATAASGGLMVSMAGERVYANAGTVTGSIGVRMDIPQLQGLMQKLGIGQETLTTGPYKDATSMTRPMTPQDRQYLEQLIQNMHDQFVDIVAVGRKMERVKASELANGKVYTGQEALRLGLIDALGGQEDAHDWLCEKVGVPPNRSLLKRPVSRTRLLEQFLGLAKLFGIDPANLSGEYAAPFQTLISY